MRSGICELAMAAVRTFPSGPTWTRRAIVPAACLLSCFDRMKVYPAESDDQASRDSAFAEGRDELAWVMRNWARAHASRQVQSLGAKILAGGPPDPAQSSFFQAYYEHALCLD